MGLLADRRFRLELKKQLNAMVCVSYDQGEPVGQSDSVRLSVRSYVRVSFRPLTASQQATYSFHLFNSSVIRWVSQTASHSDSQSFRQFVSRSIKQ